MEICNIVSMETLNIVSIVHGNLSCGYLKYSTHGNFRWKLVFLFPWKIKPAKNVPIVLCISNASLSGTVSNQPTKWHPYQFTFSKWIFLTITFVLKSTIVGPPVVLGLGLLGGSTFTGLLSSISMFNWLLKRGQAKSQTTWNLSDLETELNLKWASIIDN